MRSSKFFVLVAFALLLEGVLCTTGYADPVRILDPIAPPLDKDGTGLCSASAISTSPTSEFIPILLDRNLYNGGVNSFIEAHKNDITFRESVIRTLLDLSNNHTEPGDQSSFGDFRNVMLPTCATGGCGFFVNNDSTAFASRLRGFLNVTKDLAGQPIHFGFYVDDAISFTIFDKNATAFPVKIRPLTVGASTWRTTETVTFEKEGLYAVELLYVQFVEHAALEMSFFIGNFADFERLATVDPVITLDSAGFTLFPPTSFFHALSGVPSFPDLTACKQCNRQFVNQPGNNGCPLGLYCNEAALCAPCDSAIFCGPTCSPCGGSTPFCINRNDQYQCGECRDDGDCRPGSQCQDGTCVDCSSNDSCAGNSCNCCPGGTQCTPLEEDGTPVCAECTKNADCPSGVCNVPVGHCVDSVYENQRSDCCGHDCVQCPEDFPFCLPGPLGTACAQCRWDPDCPSGNFCLSGVCQPCTRDRRCGVRCGTCEGDTPFCLVGQTPAQSTCVRCTEDSQCGGGKCNQQTNQCEPDTCAMSCAEGLVCFGDKCVECYADTQCPCGGTCDSTTFTCSDSCKGNVDCLGNEHCRWDEDGETKECALGPLFGDTACGGTLADTCAIAVGQRPGAPVGVLFIFAAAWLAWLRRRARRGNDRGAP